MLRRFILALFALLSIIFSQAAMAANQKPPDVPNPVLQVTNGIAFYASGTTLNKLGQTGTATAPDTPPWFASMPNDIPTPNRTQWLLTGQDTTGSFENFACGTNPICEAKFRSHLGDNHVGYDDPVRNYGEPGTSHCHNFFGNTETNAHSTFASLRTRNEAHAVGGRLNGTGYWAPCQIVSNAFGDGKNYVKRMDLSALYYVNNNEISPWLVSLPFGLRYVGGMNMDDPEDTTRRRSVLVANAGAPGRYQYIGNGFNGWQCLADTTGSGTVVGLTGAQTSSGQSVVPYLKKPDGSDPFLGNCKTNATSGKKALIIADFDGPQCWDGVNPWVPGGYDNMRYRIRDFQMAGSIKEACPNGWYHIPAIRLELNYVTTGFSDYSRWRLSSDDALAAKLNALPTCTTDATGTYANAPCATRSAGGPLGEFWTGTAYVIPNGVSFHTDWFGAWDGLTLKTWEANCLGVRNLYNGNGNITSTAGSPIPSTSHTCSTSVIEAGTFMKAGAPPDSSHNPIVDFNTFRDTSTPANMFRVRTIAPSGTHDMHFGEVNDNTPLEGAAPINFSLAA